MTNDSGKISWHTHARREMRRMICLLALLSMPQLAMAAHHGQKTFTSTDSAIAALVDAIKSGDKVKLREILGPHGSKLISSGDPVADKKGRATFVKAYNETSKVIPEGDNKAVLVIGNKDWPFPIPLVKNNRAWKFDTAQGEQEILNRRIGRNEMEAIQVTLAIVDAEKEYAASHLGNTGVPEYAPRITSTTGKHDGLYWPVQSGESPSPLGPLIAAAANEGYSPERSWMLKPYRGYLYRILTAQGKDAPDGEYEYLVKGKMIGGFAAIAYPARYGASGIKTFIVNHDGVVYEKDMGQDSSSVAAKISLFNPDASWTKSEIHSDK